MWGRFALCPAEGLPRGGSLGGEEGSGGLFVPQSIEVGGGSHSLLGWGLECLDDEVPRGCGDLQALLGADDDASRCQGRGGQLALGEYLRLMDLEGEGLMPLDAERTPGAWVGGEAADLIV